MKKHLFLNLIVVLGSVTFFFCPQTQSEPVSPASSVKVVISEGEALLGDDTTSAQARAMARNNARRNALEQAAGVMVHGSSVIYNSDLISDLVVTATKGLIVKEDWLEDSKKIKGDNFSYYCKLKAHVKPIDIEKKSNLKVLKAKVIRYGSYEAPLLPVFQQNDEIQIRVTVNDNSYINIFSVSQDGMISKLYPNEYLRVEILPADKELVFPDDTQNALGMKLRVKTPNKLSKAVESVLIIVTKEKASFLSDKNIQEPMITDLMKELSEIDPSLWAEKTVGYEVRR